MFLRQAYGRFFDVNEINDLQEDNMTIIIVVIAIITAVAAGGSSRNFWIDTLWFVGTFIVCELIYSQLKLANHRRMMGIGFWQLHKRGPHRTLEPKEGEIIQILKNGTIKYLWQDTGIRLSKRDAKRIRGFSRFFGEPRYYGIKNGAIHIEMKSDMGTQQIECSIEESNNNDRRR